MEKSSNNLNGKNLVTIGVFNAIAIVLYLAFGMITGFTIVGGMFASAITFFFCATVYFLMAVKVKKRGVFMISGAVIAILALVCGYVPRAIAILVGTLITEIIVGRYHSKTKMIFGYGVFALSDLLGMFLPILMIGRTFFEDRAAKFSWTTKQLDHFMSFFTIKWVVLLSVITFVAAVIGGFIATKILKKHFVKAGMV